MVRSILAVIAGVVVGSLVNGALINFGHAVIPPPEGSDVTTMEGIKAAIQHFELRHFIFPFLAHAAGPLLGTFLTTWIVVRNKTKFAVGMGAFFLLGGVIASILIPAPLWFKAVDLIFAYVPMAYIGGKLGGAFREN